MTRPPRRLRHALVATSLLLVLAAGCGSSEPEGFRGLVREPAPEVGEVSLPDPAVDDGSLELRAEPGHVLLVYFGYTNCPDVCPTTLADVKAARADLGAAADRVDLAMVTIDPARDTPERLGPYVGSFVPGAHALVTTDDAELRAAADAFGATYAVTPQPDGAPEVQHSGFLYAVDDQGRVVLTWSFGTPVDDLVHDLELLLDQEA